MFITLNGPGTDGKTDFTTASVKCQSWHSVAIIQYTISRLQNKVPHITGTVHISQQSAFLTNHTKKTKLNSLYQYYDRECNSKIHFDPVKMFGSVRHMRCFSVSYEIMLFLTNTCREALQKYFFLSIFVLLSSINIYKFLN